MRKTKIDLSPEAEEALRAMLEVEESVKGLRIALNELKEVDEDGSESNLIGGLIISMYSPLGRIGFKAVMGPEPVIMGCQAMINEQ